MKTEQVAISQTSAEKLDTIRKKMAAVEKKKRPYSRRQALEALINMQGGLRG